MENSRASVFLLDKSTYGQGPNLLCLRTHLFTLVKATLTKVYKLERRTSHRML